MNLAPLTTIGVDEVNFHQTAWESFQWDDGFWALPIHFSPTVHPAIFDAAGLTYPSENWTLSDITSAAHVIGTLTVSNGSVSLLRSLLDGNLFDENNIPNTPYLTGHTSVALFEKWQQISPNSWLPQYR